MIFSMNIKIRSQPKITGVVLHLDMLADHAKRIVFWKESIHITVFYDPRSIKIMKLKVKIAFSLLQNLSDFL